jgi:hypothetical protein
MKKTLVSIGLLAAVLLALDSELIAQRRGGGGSRTVSGAGPYGSGTATRRTTGTVVGPSGATGRAGSGSGSYTTRGGSTIKYAGAGVVGTGPAGGKAGKAVGGVQVTTPGGKTATKVGKAGAAVGPGGNVVAGRSSVGVATGPGGTAVTRQRGGVAVGPYGAVAGGRKVGVATTRHGTYYASRTVLRTQGAYVRRSFGYYNAFRPGWYAQYPGAWFLASWTTARIWTAATWGTVASYGGYPSEPVYYDYGSTVVYEGDTVYINGEKTASADEYAQQAETLAEDGAKAKTSEKPEDWQSLGVFALVQGEEKTSYNIFQLAVDKDGIIRGNYYNALNDSTEPVQGSVDKKTQRAAWNVAKKKLPVYEAGIANLTRDETSVLVHFAKDRSQQLTLVRVEQPSEEKKEE